jgi:hypothetical protein
LDTAMLKTYAQKVNAEQLSMSAILSGLDRDVMRQHFKDVG